MPRIARLLPTVGLACDYLTDAAALADNPPSDGLFYEGAPVTEGFTAIVQRASCLNLQLVLDDGLVGLGDCVSVIRAGAHGRGRPLIAEEHLESVAEEIEPQLVGLELGSFRALAGSLDELTVAGQPLHPAIAYGLSQALLDAVAKSTRRTMAEVLAEEYGFGPPDTPVLVHASAGGANLDAVDRIIASRADVFPHGGFTELHKIGPRGEFLLEFVQRVSGRVQRWGGEGFDPVIQVDVYGTIGEACERSVDATADFLTRLADAASPYRLRVEDPIGGGSERGSRELMRELTAKVDDVGIPVQIVADEYCNTRADIGRWASERAAHMIHVKLPDLGSLTNAAEAVLACRQAQIGVYVGGTLNDTDVSGRATTHLALALRADQVMAKPGRGADVSIALTRNEMARTLALIASR